MNYAARILINYFSQVMGSWDSDNSAEIESAIDLIVSTAAAQVADEILAQLADLTPAELLAWQVRIKKGIQDED